MNPLGEAATRAARNVLKHCDQCSICSKECPLIKQRGLPHDHARDALSGRLDPELAFLCSLCGLCSAVCPRKADPAALYRLLRAERAAAGTLDPAPYADYLETERRRLSPLHTLFGAREGARRAFFPGCSLSGMRPDTVFAVWRLLDEREPTAFVLACCAHRSRTLGRADAASARMEEIATTLRNMGVAEVLTPCAGCREALLGTGLDVRTVYEVLAGDGLEEFSREDGLDLAVQDPCPWRAERPVHEAVRDLIWATGHAVSEMRHAWHRTSCCGAGGAASLAGSDLPGHWLAQREEEAAGRPVVCACAGCLRTLSARVPAIHLLDLHLGADPLQPPPFLEGRSAEAARLLLKRRVRAFLRRGGHPA